MAAAAAANAVAVNVAGVVTPPTDAVILSSPGIAPSVYNMLARPLASVVDVGAASVPVPAIRVHATVAPETGLPKLSVTRTTNGDANTRSTIPCRSFPDTATIDAALPTSAVKENVTLLVVIPMGIDAMAVAGPTTEPRLNGAEA